MRVGKPAQRSFENWMGTPESSSFQPRDHRRPILTLGVYGDEIARHRVVMGVDLRGSREQQDLAGATEDRLGLGLDRDDIPGVPRSRGREPEPPDVGPVGLGDREVAAGEVGAAVDRIRDLGSVG